MGLIFLVGYMGAGKTYWGKKLAGEMCVDFIDLDNLIEEGYKLSINQIFKLYGESRFREIEREFLFCVLSKGNAIVATGGGTPCFYDNMNQMKLHGSVIYLKRTVQELYDELILQQDNRPLIRQLSEVDLKKKISSMLIEREPIYIKADYIIEDYDPREQIKVIGGF